MARLPQVGGDEGSWGQLLNEYMLVAHENDGTIKSGSIGAAQIDASSVAAAQLLRGTFASRPSASSSSNLYYLATDLNGGTLFQSTGSAWVQASASTLHQTLHQSGGSDALTGSVDANARMAVAKNATIAGTRRSLNLIPGTNIDIQLADNSVNERVDTTIGLTGSVAIANGGTGASNVTSARTNLEVAQADGFAKMTVGTVAPASPAVGDIWVDTN